MYARRVTGVTVRKPAAGNELHHYFIAIWLLVRNAKRTSNIGCGVKPHDFDFDLKFQTKFESAFQTALA
ncbi:Uncharacterised protein [Shewanella putrefaciens]|nr:Uncharacterised protein [Shewanella putrefaciens]